MYSALTCANPHTNIYTYTQFKIKRKLEKKKRTSSSSSVFFFPNSWKDVRSDPGRQLMSLEVIKEYRTMWLWVCLSPCHSHDVLIIQRWKTLKGLGMPFFPPENFNSPYLMLGKWHILCMQRLNVIYNPEH